MQNVHICLYSTNVSVSIKINLGPQTKMFALVLVLKKKMVLLLGIYVSVAFFPPLNI